MTFLKVPSSGEMKILDKKRLDELVKEVDPMEQLDEEVEEVKTILIASHCMAY